MSEKIQLLAPHPHAGERGTIDGSGMVLNGKTMLRVELADCKHGTAACFALESHIGRVTVTPLRKRKARS